jgi:hypothetical protein
MQLVQRNHAFVPSCLKGKLERADILGSMELGLSARRWPHETRGTHLLDLLRIPFTKLSWRRRIKLISSANDRHATGITDPLELVIPFIRGRSVSADLTQAIVVCVAFVL